jgi:hypothetical protein
VYIQAYVVLFIYGILNNAVSNSDYVGLNGKIMVNNDKERMWKEVVRALTEILSKNFPQSD